MKTNAFLVDINLDESDLCCMFFYLLAPPPKKPKLQNSDFCAMVPRGNFSVLTNSFNKFMKYHSGINEKGSFFSGGFSGPLNENEVFHQVEWVVIACGFHYPQNVALV